MPANLKNKEKDIKVRPKEILFCHSRSSDGFWSVERGFFCPGSVVATTRKRFSLIQSVCVCEREIFSVHSLMASRPTGYSQICYRWSITYNNGQIPACCYYSYLKRLRKIWRINYMHACVCVCVCVCRIINFDIWEKLFLV